MTDSALDRAYEEAEKEFHRYWERGKYYYEQGNREQANENFVLGFENFSKSIILGYLGENFDDETKSTCLISIYIVLEQVYLSFNIKDNSNNYPHKTILAYLLINMRKILDYLSTLKSYFTVDDIKVYENICTSMHTFNLQFTRKDLSEELENVNSMIKSTPPDKTSNETLKRLRLAFKKISHKEFLPNFETTKDSSCFIATAAYSTSIHPDLDTFRQFRDRSLLTNSLGRLFVSVYYKIGPQLAQFVNRSLYVKKIVRLLLEKLASFMRSRYI